MQIWKNNPWNFTIIKIAIWSQWWSNVRQNRETSGGITDLLNIVTDDTYSCTHEKQTETKLKTKMITKNGIRTPEMKNKTETA